MDVQTENKELLKRLLLHVQNLESLITTDHLRIEYLLQNKINPEYLTLKETSLYMKKSIKSIRLLIDSGRIKAYKAGDGKTSKIILSRFEIENYIRGTE